MIIHGILNIHGIIIHGSSHFAAFGTFVLVFTVGCAVASPTPSPWAPLTIATAPRRRNGSRNGDGNGLGAVKTGGFLMDFGDFRGKFIVFSRFSGFLVDFNGIFIVF